MIDIMKIMILILLNIIVDDFKSDFFRNEKHGIIAQCFWCNHNIYRVFTLGPDVKLKFFKQLNN